MSVIKKLAEFKKIVGGVAKDGSNPFHKSKYSTIESVLETIKIPLEQVGLCFVQCVDDMKLNTFIYDVEKEESKISSSVPLILSKNDMQQLGSAITYARRYALVSMLGLEQDDDDGNHASGCNNKTQYQNPTPPPKPQTKPQTINQNQVLELESLFLNEEEKKQFLAKAKINNIQYLPSNWFEKAKASLAKK